MDMNKSLFCMILVFLITGTTFGQIPRLTLDGGDIRFEPAYSNGVVNGYYLFVHKKPGIESVMVTEPSGRYALRSLKRNEVNGNERRELAGVELRDTYSRFSIVSSTTISDSQFGYAFLLFIPINVVYGNPSSSVGIIPVNIHVGVQINVRTFDHKYADPNIGRYQNNLFPVNVPDIVREYFPPPAPVSGLPPYPPPRPQPSPSEGLRNQFWLMRIDSDILKSFHTEEELKDFIKHAFSER